MPRNPNSFSGYTQGLSEDSRRALLELKRVQKEIQDAGEATDAALADYLPLTGGSLSGILYMNHQIRMQSDAQFRADYGTAALPGITFHGDNDTGLYRVGSNSLGFTIAGTRALQVGTTHMNFGPSASGGWPSIQHDVEGTAGEPAFTFAGDKNTGMFRVAADEVGFSTGGSEVARFTGNNLRFAVSTGAIYGHGYDRAGNGSAATPSQSFNSRTYQGMYSGSSTSVRFSSTNNSSYQFSVNSDHLYAPQPIRLGDGSAGTPAVNFASDGNTGMYRISGDRLGFSLGATLRGDMQTSRFKYQTTSGYIEIGPNNSSYCHFNTDRGQFYMNKRLEVNGSICSYSTSNAVYGISGITYIQCYSDASTETTYMYMGDLTNPTVSRTNYYKMNTSACFRTRNSNQYDGQVAATSWWTQYSTDRHAIALVYNTQGDKLNFVNAENSAYVPLQASAFTVISSEKSKARIRTARNERGLLDYAVPGPKDLAYEQFMKLRPVLFDDKVQHVDRIWVGCDIHDDREECREAGCVASGAEAELLADTTHNVQHICDEAESCGGTNERPCWNIEEHVDRVGFIAEEVNEVYPKTVPKDVFGEITGIDYTGPFQAEIVNVVQRLIEDNRELTARVEALESRGRPV